VGRQARLGAEGGHDGGWRLREAAVANCEAADRFVNSLRHARPRRGEGQNAQFAGAGRVSASRGETLLLLPPRHSHTFMQARSHGEPRGIGSGCEIHSAREGGHHTNCIEYRTRARIQPLESLARGCSGSKFFCTTGPAVQGRSSYTPSPARPSLDFDHALLSALCSLDQVSKRSNTI
jgi:hypothetical protein